MRPMALILLLLTVMATAGCSTVRVSQDYDPQADLSRFNTWQWRDTIQPSTGDIRVDNPLLNKRLRRAVENHLADRNFSLAQGQPDLYLTYHLDIEQKIQSETYHSMVGVGYYYHPWYGGFDTETRIRQYDESRLIIDIRAADTDNLLWRGMGTYRLTTHKTPQKADAAVQNIVDQILFQFPPQSRQ